MNNKNKASDQQKEIIINIYLNFQKLTLVQVYEEANAKFIELDLNPLSKSTVRRILQNLQSSEKINRKAIERNYVPLKLSYKSDSNKKIWLIDDMRLDIMCYDENNELMRPYLSIIMEQYSKKIIGYIIAKGIVVDSRLKLISKVFKETDSYPDIIRLYKSKINLNNKLIQGIRDIIKVASDCEIQYSNQLAYRGDVERFFLYIDRKFFNNPIHSSRVKKTSSEHVALTISNLNEFVARQVQDYTLYIENKMREQ